MAHFYGTLKGARGETTRCGTRTSGMDAVAASWQGAVHVDLYEKDGTDFARVSLRQWHGRGESHPLYHGEVGRYKPVNPPDDDERESLKRQVHEWAAVEGAPAPLVAALVDAMATEQLRHVVGQHVEVEGCAV
jgi:hypothetical protein